MQLVLSEDQELLAKTAGDWVREHSPVARFRQLRDANDATGFSRPLWKQMAELGWVGIPFPEALGGAGMGFADLAVVLEALGRTLAPEPLLPTVLLGGRAIALGGSAAQKKAWLPGICEGSALLAFAHAFYGRVLAHPVGGGLREEFLVFGQYELHPCPTKFTTGTVPLVHEKFTPGTVPLLHSGPSPAG